MKHPLMMSAGAFEMAPLSDFIVTETRPRPKTLPKMSWAEWRKRCRTDGTNYDYDFGDYDADGKRRLLMKINRPADVEVALGDADATMYVIVWADDPDAA